MECISCQTVLKEEAKFCHACGTKVETVRKCMSCGHVLEAQDVFCSQCGTRAVEEKGNAAASCVAGGARNKYGNSTTNLNVSAMYSVTWQGSDGYASYGHSIYRITDDEIEEIYQGEKDFTSLNIIGDTLYFTDMDSIYSLHTDGSGFKRLYSLKEAGDVGYIRMMIAVEDALYFATTESLLPFIARISADDGHFRTLYKPLAHELNKPGDEFPENYIQIIDISDKWILARLDGAITRKILISTNGKLVLSPHEHFSLRDLLDDYPSTEEEIREAEQDFDGSIVRIDFERQLLHMGYWKWDRVSFDGKDRDLYWNKADWERQANNPSDHRPNGFHLPEYRDLEGIRIGFAYGGPHYYTLFRIYPDGRVVCLGGDGSQGGGENLQVAGNWAYWGSRRQNLQTGEEQKLHFREGRIERV